MSTTTQEKFFRLLMQRAEAAGLDLVVDRSFSNVGSLRLQDRDSFGSERLALPFDFQPDRVHFGWKVRRLGQPVFKNRPNPYFAGFAPHELDQALDAIMVAAADATGGQSS